MANHERNAPHHDPFDDSGPRPDHDPAVDEPVPGRPDDDPERDDDGADGSDGGDGDGRAPAPSSG